MTTPLPSTPCEIRTRDGSYPSVCFGFFQYTDSESSYPVAVIKRKDGTLGSVHVGCVVFDPAEWFMKDGKRVAIDRNPAPKDESKQQNHG
jgi:hypothetical protein